jgi:squamous cell carcinoma antigen recognized by T-cells 3
VEVRFPSLQGNTHRRFCYVQFSDPSSALKATQLDGQVLDGQYHLQAKVSNPTRKENRHGAIYEGREIFIRNVHYGATEAEVKELCSSCGPIERVRIPTNLNGKGKGVAFVVFEDKSSAEKAVETLNNTAFKSRTIAVEISAPKGKRVETTIRRNTASATPELESLPDAPSANGDAQPPNARNYKERTIAILNLSDTVNVARLEKLVEPYGATKKIALRPDHGGAFVEFAEQKSVALATLGLENIEVDGKKIQISTVEELMQQNPEKKAQKIAERLKEEAATKAGKGTLTSSGPVSRPGQGGARRGGRGGRGGHGGGLGKRTGLGFGAPKSNGDQVETGSGKTNAEFRDLFLKGGTNGASFTQEDTAH